jgi:hypothetical protein
VCLSGNQTCFIAALIFAGSITMKKMISAQPVAILVGGTCKQIAAAISKTQWHTPVLF